MEVAAPPPNKISAALTLRLLGRLGANRWPAGAKRKTAGDERRARDPQHRPGPWLLASLIPGAMIIYYSLVL